MDFQILALPRSRTLWLSHLLTRDNVQCIHEGQSYFQMEMPKEQGKIIGSVDTCPLWYEPQTDYPVVVIESAVSQRLTSIMANFNAPFGISVPAFEEFMHRILMQFQDKLNSIDGKNVLRIGSAWLNREASLLEISNHLTPDIPLDIGRIKSYLDTRIKTKNRNIEPHITAVAAQYGLSGPEFVLDILDYRDAS